MPDRHGPMRSGSAVFVERANGGAVSGGAVVAHGPDLGMEGLALPFLDGEPAVAPEGVGLLAPAGVRGGDRVDPADVMVLVASGAVEGEEWRASEAAIPSTTWIPGTNWIPSTTWIPGTNWIPSTNWIPGTNWMPDDPASARVVATGGERSFEAAFGVPAGELDGQPVGEEAFTGDDAFVLAAPATAVPELAEGYAPGELFAAGRAAPLGGLTFGTGVLSTPDASVAGEPANPLVDLSTGELLQREELRRVLGRVGATDADEVEWLAGPGPFGEGPETELLGEPAALEAFGGVVAGEAGPWAVAVHVARATPEDHVVAVGVHRTPVASADADLDALWPKEYLEHAGTYAAESVARLDQG